MLVAQMAAGQFDKAVGPFDPTMKRALPAAKLKEAWEGLTTQFGLLRRAVETTTGKAAQYDVVFVTCEFERGKLDAKVKSSSLTVDSPKSELPLGAPASYWLDLRGYEPPTAAKELSEPMLILQGERDYQVTMQDFAAWKKALGSRKDVTFLSYARLNHLFIDGEGKCTPAEYLTPGNVAGVVIEDITRWVKSVQ